MLRLIPVLLIISVNTLAGTTLYKTVDENGKISYSDQPPVNGAPAEEVVVEEDGITNILPSADLQKQIDQQQRQDKQDADRKGAADKAWQQRYRSAQSELEQAQKDLASAKEIKEGDTVGSAFGGARPNANWIENLERAEAEVAEKQDALNKIKRQRR